MSKYAILLLSKLILRLAVHQQKLRCRILHHHLGSSKLVLSGRICQIFQHLESSLVLFHRKGWRLYWIWNLIFRHRVTQLPKRRQIYQNGLRLKQLRCLCFSTLTLVKFSKQGKLVLHPYRLMTYMHPAKYETFFNLRFKTSRHHRSGPSSLSMC